MWCIKRRLLATVARIKQVLLTGKLRRWNDLHTPLVSAHSVPVFLTWSTATPELFRRIILPVMYGMETYCMFLCVSKYKQFPTRHVHVQPAFETKCYWLTIWPVLLTSSVVWVAAGGVFVASYAVVVAPSPVFVDATPGFVAPCVRRDGWVSEYEIVIERLQQNNESITQRVWSTM